jgi:sulfur transfer complex TusBCD TusB component (DsrH family)
MIWQNHGAWLTCRQDLSSRGVAKVMCPAFFMIQLSMIIEITERPAVASRLIEIDSQFP